MSFSQDKITIFLFGTDISEREFPFGLGTSKEALKNSIIKQVTALEGGTILNDCITRAAPKLKDYDICLLVTDGENNGGFTTSDSAIEALSEARKASAQWACYTVGLGSHYSKPVFDAISRSIGSTHIDLNAGNIAGLEEVLQYVGTSGREKSMWSFLAAELAPYFEQITADDVAIGAQCINPFNTDTAMTHNGEEYTVTGGVGIATD